MGVTRAQLKEVSSCSCCRCTACWALSGPFACGHICWRCWRCSGGRAAALLQHRIFEAFGNSCFCVHSTQVVHPSLRTQPPRFFTYRFRAEAPRGVFIYHLVQQFQGDAPSRVCCVHNGSNVLAALFGGTWHRVPGGCSIQRLSEHKESVFLKLHGGTAFHGGVLTTCCGGNSSALTCCFRQHGLSAAAHLA